MIFHRYCPSVALCTHVPSVPVGDGRRLRHRTTSVDGGPKVAVATAQAVASIILNRKMHSGVVEPSIIEATDCQIVTCSAYCRLLKPRAQGIVRLEEMKTRHRAGDWSLPMLIRFVTLFGPPPHPPCGHPLPVGARGKGPGPSQKRGDRDHSSRSRPSGDRGWGGLTKDWCRAGPGRQPTLDALVAPVATDPSPQPLSAPGEGASTVLAPGCANRTVSPHPSPLPPGEGASTESHRARLSNRTVSARPQPFRQEKGASSESVRRQAARTVRRLAPSPPGERARVRFLPGHEYD